ncbi:MAG TPA: carbohydrate ABC transporter permease [Actinomycetota bacterium]|jgi:multiple sugar transport system permease protein
MSVVDAASDLHRARIEEADRLERRQGWRRMMPDPWHFVLFPLSIVMVLPFAWMFVTSFMTDAEINQFPPAIVPHSLYLGGYQLVLGESDFPRWFLNTSFVAAVVVVSQLVMCSLAGYAFARIRFAGKRFILPLLLATALIPFQLTVIPTFLIFYKVHLINTLWSLIVPSLTSVFGIYLMSSFFQSFPKELEEAAQIDGCTRLGTFFRVVLPLARPALSALAIISFIYAWNDLFWPLIAITSTKLYTVQLGLTTFQGQHRTEWSAVMSGTVLSTAPVLLIFLIGQRRFVQALTGAVKG